MKERHAAELKAFQQRLISKTSTPKFSKDLLNLRKIQEVLAKKKECVGMGRAGGYTGERARLTLLLSVLWCRSYSEAAKIKQKADELVSPPPPPPPPLGVWWLLFLA